MLTAMAPGPTFEFHIARAARDAVGFASARTRVSAYARHALAPWFVLGGALPSAWWAKTSASAS